MTTYLVVSLPKYHAYTVYTYVRKVLANPVSDANEEDAVEE
jgi:hypothetical protein